MTVTSSSLQGTLAREKKKKIAVDEASLVTTCLHVSGLTPAISPSDVRSKLASFGEVLKVRTVGLDALGQPRPFLFVDVRSTEAQVKRCLTVLGGVTWKGAKLRVGYAKKEATQMYSETQDGESEPPRKRRRLPRGAGQESKRIDRPIELADVDKGEWGWKKTPAGHLVRPMIQRPPHPLPRPAPLKGADGKLTSTRKHRKLSLITPPTRARRTTLDPMRYGATHLTGLMLDALGEDETPCSRMAWVCEQSTAEETVRWVRGAEEQVVSLRTRRVPEGASIYHETTEEQATSRNAEAQGVQTIEAVEKVGNSAAATSDVNVDEEVEDLDQKRLPDVRTAAAPSRPIPIPYDPDNQSLFSEGYDENSAPAPPSSNAGVVDFEAERRRTLNWLRDSFGDDFIASKGELERNALEMGDDDIVEDADEMPARITGVIATTSKGMQSKDDGERAQEEAEMDEGKENRDQAVTELEPPFSPSETSSSDDDDTDVNEKHLPVDAAAAPTPATHDAQPTLREMFKPREESAGFSLLSGLDLDMDPSLDFDLSGEAADAQPAPPAQSVPTTSSVTASRIAVQDGAHRLPFFFPRYLSDGRPNPSERNILTVLAPTVSASGHVVPHPKSAPDDIVVRLPFCRTHTDAELQAIWEERRTNLTDEYRRRHREAVRKKRRGYVGSRKEGKGSQ